ncbi:MAG: TRAFAC clade GTPase domain-containing protein, partial [Candidatus Saccharimonadales bacterium]
MIKEGVQPLDSMRLVANYAAQAPCYICGADNTYDAELCRQCSAPMALSHQAASQKIRPCMLAAIGASGAGKTV